LNGILEIPKDKRMVISGWVKEDCGNSVTGVPCGKTTFNDGYLSLNIPNGIFKASGPIIEGWQRIEGVFTVPASTTSLQLSFNNSSGGNVYFDDLRIHPYNGNMKSYVYDPVNLRLVAELDANNFSKYYEYDGEGTLIRTKAETVEGIKTINETRSSKQKVINAIQ
ncbi:hypothetical protein, partial [Polluticaenibacter yanchengensis]|nr:hypothetical protein [Chitinophagaceae bacterium LY-5]